MNPLTRMFIHEFELLLIELSHLISLPGLRIIAKKLSFEDKILLIFFWMTKYPVYSEISQLSGISPPLVRQLIHYLGGLGFLTPLVV